MAQAPAPTSSLAAFSPVLDDPATYALDRQGMLAHAARFGADLRAAWRQTADLQIPRGTKAIRSVIVAGVGGSATGGDYLAALSRCASPLPVQVVRGFDLPTHAGEDTLVVCCSHSGDTEETLACFDDARRRGCQLITVATGGELLRRSRDAGVSGVVYSVDAPPRAALPWSLAALLRAGNASGITALSGREVETAARRHEALIASSFAPGIPTLANGAKSLAQVLTGAMPLVVAADHLEVAANRFRNQLAENGKALAMATSLPEMGHNLVVALDDPAISTLPIAVVTVESPRYHPRIAQRFDIVTGMFEARGIGVCRIVVGGDSLLGDLVEATAWGDFTSTFLALNAGHDPSPVWPIDELKACIASQGAAR